MSSNLTPSATIPADRGFNAMTDLLLQVEAPVTVSWALASGVISGAVVAGVMRATQARQTKDLEDHERRLRVLEEAVAVFVEVRDTLRGVTNKAVDALISNQSGHSQSKD